MKSSSPLSALSDRTSGSPISELMQRALANPDLISLAAGFVDTPSLPVDAVLRASEEILSDPREARRALQYGTTIGDLHLRRQLVRRLEREEGQSEGTYAGLEQRMVVTAGSQQLLYLLAEALLNPGDIVLVESPTYFVFIGLLQSRGVRIIGVDTDEAGLRLDALEQTLSELAAQGELERVKFLYTVSEHSNPTGLSLAADRRAGLVRLVQQWSRSHEIYILEDAAYRGLAFQGEEPPSVWSHDPDGRTVVLARTFSKTFSPGLKTGFGVLPHSLVEPVLNLKGQHDFGTNNFVQMLLDRVLADGSYDAQVLKLREIYGRKCQILDSALRTYLADFDGVAWTHPAGGLYIWLALPEDLDTGRNGPLFSRCLERGVLYVPGEYAFAEIPAPVPTRFARLCYGVPSEDELTEGARRLAEALSECLHPVA